MGQWLLYYWDMAYMRVFGALVCRCDALLQNGKVCARVWIAEKGELPRRCARCKSMRWNQDKVSDRPADASKVKSERLAVIPMGGRLEHVDNPTDVLKRTVRDGPPAEIRELIVVKDEES